MIVSALSQAIQQQHPASVPIIWPHIYQPLTSSKFQHRWLGSVFLRCLRNYFVYVAGFSVKLFMIGWEMAPPTDLSNHKARIIVAEGYICMWLPDIRFLVVYVVANVGSCSGCVEYLFSIIRYCLAVRTFAYNAADICETVYRKYQGMPLCYMTFLSMLEVPHPSFSWFWFAVWTAYFVQPLSYTAWR